MSTKTRKRARDRRAKASASTGRDVWDLERQLIEGPRLLPRREPPPGALAVPAVAWVYTQAVLSTFALRLPAGSRRWFEFGGTFPDEKRNILIREHFLPASDLEWLYFSDSDHVVPSDTVLHLLATGCDVVGALYYGALGRKVTPAGEHLMVHSPEAGGDEGRVLEVQARVTEAIEAGELCEVDWVGAGALLVRRAVFERVPPPWFFRGPAGGEDEDVHFCEKVRAAGFQVHLHAGVVVGHVQAVPVGLTFEEALV